MTKSQKCIKMQLKSSCKEGVRFSMSQHQKALDRLRSLPNDYTYTELKQILRKFGYQEHNKGNTSGSRVRFYRESDEAVIDLHKPHPGDIIKKYALKLVVEKLTEKGDL